LRGASPFWIIVAVSYTGEADASISRDWCRVPDGMGNADIEPCGNLGQYQYGISVGCSRLRLPEASASPRLAPPRALLRVASPALAGRSDSAGACSAVAGI